MELVENPSITDSGSGIKSSFSLLFSVKFWLLSLFVLEPVLLVSDLLHLCLQSLYLLPVSDYCNIIYCKCFSVVFINC